MYDIKYQFLILIHVCIGKMILLRIRALFGGGAGYKMKYFVIVRTPPYLAVFVLRKIFPLVAMGKFGKIIPNKQPLSIPYIVKVTPKFDV